MIATIWRFRVPAEFCRGVRTDVRTLRRMGRTIDSCNSEADFHAAKRMLEREYAALDRRSEAYTSEETRLGLYAFCE